MARFRKLMTKMLLVALICLASLLAVSAWAIAPYSSRAHYVVETAGFLARAPFASRMVIGDSRIEYASAPRGVLFVGYGSATSRDLSRVTRVLCRASGAQVTIALGINDTKPSEWDEAASRVAFAQMAKGCARKDLWLAQIWPAEQGVPPAGDDYLPDAAARLDTHIAELAQSAGAGWIPVPDLARGYTYDGVHFTGNVSRLYAQILSFPDRPGQGD